MKISEDMVRDFNMLMAADGSVIRLKFIREPFYTKCELVPSNMMYLNSFTLNPNDEFYAYLERFFKGKGVNLKYNNTGSIFWGDDFGDEKKEEKKQGMTRRQYAIEMYKNAIKDEISEDEFTAQMVAGLYLYRQESMGSYEKALDEFEIENEVMRKDNSGFYIAVKETIRRCIENNIDILG